MTDTTALDALIEAVERGRKITVGDLPDHMPNHWFNIIKANDGDLNATKALHEALLPEWGYVDLLSRGKRHTCRIARSVGEADFSAVSHDLAIARLLATLKAYRASL